MNSNALLPAIPEQGDPRITKLMQDVEIMQHTQANMNAMQNSMNTRLTTLETDFKQWIVTATEDRSKMKTDLKEILDIAKFMKAGLIVVGRIRTIAVFVSTFGGACIFIWTVLQWAMKKAGG